MSLEPEKKPSLLAPLSDQYKLTEGGADHILAKIQSAYLQDTGNASPASTAARSSTGKLSLLLGSTCAALAIIGVTLQRSSTSEPPVTAPSAITAPSGTMQPNEPAREVEPAVAVPSVSVDSLPSVPEVPPSARTSSKMAPVGARDVPSTAKPAPANDTLDQEARLLTDARQALEHGDGAEALARLDEHARRFPNGWFAAERAAERIIVLCSLGRRAEAVDQAKVFLESRPKSPLTRRVESSCAGEAAITKAGK